jgi:uncharacterized repeat protein (TIGR01451 family)
MPPKGPPLLLLLAVLAALALAGPAAAAESCVSTGRVCLSVTSEPATASINGFASYVVALENKGPNTVNQVVLTDTTPDGRPVASVTPTALTCATTGGTVRCATDQLPSGATASVRISVSTPAVPATLVNSASVSFNEGGNDNEAGRQDTIAGVTASTVVTATPGTGFTWVPPGIADVPVTTDPLGTGLTAAQQQTARAVVPRQAVGVTAKLNQEPLSAFACPPRQVCRAGGWLEATIPFVYTDTALRISLAWAGALVPRSQTAKNFVLFYRDCEEPGCPPTKVISARCSSPEPPKSELPCLTGVSVAKNRDTRATLVSSHNGRMR